MPSIENYFISMRVTLNQLLNSWFCLLSFIALALTLESKLGKTAFGEVFRDVITFHPHQPQSFNRQLQRQMSRQTNIWQTTCSVYREATLATVSLETNMSALSYAQLLLWLRKLFPRAQGNFDGQTLGESTPDAYIHFVWAPKKHLMSRSKPGLCGKLEVSAYSQVPQRRCH